MPSDKIDNDCDGTTDEEMVDGKDNDGDGLIDEDFIQVVNSIFGEGGLLPFNEVESIFP